MLNAYGFKSVEVTGFHRTYNKWHGNRGRNLELDCSVRIGSISVAGHNQIMGYCDELRYHLMAEHDDNAMLYNMDLLKAIATPAGMYFATPTSC